MLDSKSLTILADALARLDEGFRHLPEFEARRASDERLREVLAATAEKLQDNFPYFHPLYAGQMLKPPHPVARLAYALALWLNPNNHARDGGRASSAMEQEAVAHPPPPFRGGDPPRSPCRRGPQAQPPAPWGAGA